MTNSTVFSNTTQTSNGTPIMAEWLNDVNTKTFRTIDVTIYGAKGDGVTDDTAAIQAAFTAAYNSNGTAQKTVFFPSGQYVVSSTIVAMASFCGEGPYENNVGSRIKWVGSADKVFSFPDEYKTGWSFENLEIDMSNVTTDCTGMHFAQGVNNASFRNLRFKGWYSGGSFYGGTYKNHDGIFVVGGSGVGGTPYNMSNCIFDHCFFVRTRNCVTVTNPVPDSSGTNCTFNACLSISSGWFAKMGGANNTFIACETNSMAGSHTFILDTGFAYSWLFLNCDFGTESSAPGNEIIAATYADAVNFATILNGTLELSYNGGAYDAVPDLVLDPGATGGRVLRYMAHGINNFQSNILRVEQIKLGQALGGELNFYEEGTFTPVFTSLAVVLGAGSVTYTGSYTRVGRLVSWQAKIQPSGGATTEATGGTTFIGNLPYNILGLDSNCTVTNAGTLASYGVGVGSAGTNDMYMPTWPAVANGIVMSGHYFTDGTV